MVTSRFSLFHLSLAGEGLGGVEPLLLPLLLSLPKKSRSKDGYRSYLKKIFCPNLDVGAGFKILDILQYACRRSRVCLRGGLKPGPAFTLDQNPFF